MRGGKKSKPTPEPGSDTASSEKEDDERKSKPASCCARPNKPRLSEDKCKEIQAECRKACCAR